MKNNKISIKTMLILGTINIIELVVAICLSVVIFNYVACETLAYILVVLVIGGTVFHTKISFSKKVLDKKYTKKL